MPDPDKATSLMRYRERRLIAMTEVGEEVAGRLAMLVPGLRGVALYLAARGDPPGEAARLLGITREALDDLLATVDGQDQDGL